MTETRGSMIAAARASASEVAPAEAYDEHKQGAVHLIIDVREPQEFRDAHVADSINIPRGLLELRADAAAPSADPTLSADPSKRIILYCTKSPGARSLLAAKTLESMGYENVDVLGGGLNAWEEAGLPIERAASGG